MTWKQETGPDGLPIWCGKDSIVNIARGAVRDFKWGATPILVAVCAFSMFGILSGNPAGQILGWVMAPMIPIFVWVLIALRREGGATTKEWLGESWSLAATSADLTFAASVGWSVPIDNIASVEIARSSEWEPLRRFGATEWPTPTQEWQTFLVLADQTRRVIYRANAERDGCAALRASIAAYVERARAASAAPIAAPVMAAASPSGEDFDL